MKRVKTTIFFILYFTATLLFAQKYNFKITKESSYNTIIHNGKIAIKKGDYTLIPALSEKKDIKWAKNFQMVEMGGVDDFKITKELLKKRGILNIKYHIGYDWMPATYYYTNGENRDFVKWLYTDRFHLTLNPNGPFVHCKKNHYNWCKDYYYDYGNELLIDKRVENLMKNLKRSGFNGLFFDWASGSFINNKNFKIMKNNFEKKHKKKNYFIQIAKFYKKLKKEKIFFVTNQAFRQEKYLLKNIIYDMTESYITTNRTKKMDIQIVGKGWIHLVDTTDYYPIYKNSKSIKDSLHFIDILTSYKNKYKKYGFKNFIYLNYIAPKYERVYSTMPIYRLKKPKNAIYFGYAMAKLTNNIVYAQISKNKELEKDSVYFYDLGSVLGKKYIKINPYDIYIRFYTNGFVVASEAYNKNKYIKITSDFIPNNKFIYNPYDDNWIKSGKHSVTIKISYEKDTFTQKKLPTGRVFLYEKD